MTSLGNDFDSVLSKHVLSEKWSNPKKHRVNFYFFLVVEFIDKLEIFIHEVNLYHATPVNEQYCIHDCSITEYPHCYLLCSAGGTGSSFFLADSKA